MCGGECPNNISTIYVAIVIRYVVGVQSIFYKVISVTLSHCSPLLTLGDNIVCCSVEGHVSV